METTTTTQPKVIDVSQTAAKKVAELLEREGSPDYFLRVAVQPGGCAGLKYALYFDDRRLDGDHESVVDGVTVRVDKMSAPYLRGAKIEWLEGLEQSGFTIDNPNSGGSCACGDSFH